MARVNTFIYCESSLPVPSDQGTKFNVIQPLTKLKPAFIPSAYSFSVVICLENVECDKSFKLRLEFCGVDDETLLDTMDINVPPNNENKNGDGTSDLIMSLDLRNIIIKSLGEYKSKLYFNDELISTNPIRVRTE